MVLSFNNAKISISISEDDLIALIVENITFPCITANNDYNVRVKIN